MEATKTLYSECLCENTREEQSTSSLSFWRTSQSESKWPPEPSTLTYVQVHRCRPQFPYCIYALKHEATVAASSLNNYDAKRFSYRDVPNGTVFTNYEELLKVVNEQAVRLTKQVQNLSSLIPEQGMREVLNNLKDKINAYLLSAAANQQQNLLSIRSDIMNIFDNPVMNINVIALNTELQLNVVVNSILLKELMKYGFKQCSFSRNDYSVFGSSFPDFAFFKSRQPHVVAGVVKLPALEESEVIGDDVVYGTIEYKMSSSRNHMFQCFANMIRVANDCVISSLESGILLETVTVYGLLSSHDTYLCEPMKYFCDFTKPPVLTVGSTENFAKLFYCIMQC